MVAATLEVADLTGLVRGARRGEGLGNELLAHMRTTDALLLVVRCFQDDGVAHPNGAVNPLDDAETVELELIFADQAAVERRLERVTKTAKSGDRGWSPSRRRWSSWPRGSSRAGRRARWGLSCRRRSTC